MTPAVPPFTADMLPTPAPAFLAQHGLGGVATQGFVADASSRSYVRLIGARALLIGRSPHYWCAKFVCIGDCLFRDE